MNDKLTIETAKFSVLDQTPSYNITFHRDGKRIGVLDFNGPAMTFEGEADDSAKVFFDWIAQSFYGRLEEERIAEREAAMAAIIDGCPCDGSDTEIILRRAWERVRLMRSNVPAKGRAESASSD